MNNINVVCLGGASEVGRSCVIIESENTSIMLDCGIHPAFMGIGCLPIYDAYDISKIDFCLITHFHMDHSGALPYLINRTRFKGRIFMTEATKSICYLLWKDYSRIEKCMNLINKNKSSKNKKDQDDENTSVEFESDINMNALYSSDDNIDDEYFNKVDLLYESYNGDDNSNNVLYEEDDIDRTMELIETINFHQNLEFPNVKFTAYRAGHVIGACMFLVEINNVRFLYTGDYSREIDRHIPIAEIPNIDVHVLICEGTYGIKVHDNRKKREIRFLNMLTNILNNKGKVLLPVFALGRAQELLLILEEHWESNRYLQKIPIFYISSMATKSLSIYETFINLCGDFVKNVVNEGKNPFNFKYVKYAKSLDSILSYLYQDNNPCVIMAAPGMLQNGVSRNIFNIIASDNKSGVILTGYTVKGTLADELKTEPEYVTINDKIVKRKCRFEQISFSAHSDFNQTKTFIEKLKCPNIILVHGYRNELNRLRDKLIEEKKYLSVFTPELLQKVSFHFEHNDHLISLGKLSTHIKKINKKMIKYTKLKRAKDGETVEEANEDIDAAVAQDAKAEGNEVGETERFQQVGNITEEENKINSVKVSSISKMEGKNNLITALSSNDAEGKGKCDKVKASNIISEDIEAVIITELKTVPIIIYPNDINKYTNLKTALIDQIINIKYPYRFDLLYDLLSNVYEETLIDDNVIYVKDIKIIYCKEEKMIKINWFSSPINDLVADSINFLVLEFLDTMASNKNLPIYDDVTDQHIYEMIISFVEENYANVERISKIEIKNFLMHNGNKDEIEGKERKDSSFNDKRNNNNNNNSNNDNSNNDNSNNSKNSNYDNSERSKNYDEERRNIGHCENYDCTAINQSKSMDSSYLSNKEHLKFGKNFNSSTRNFHAYDKVLLDYIAKHANLELKNDEEIEEILKFDVKDNYNNDVQVFVDIDNREVICKEESILIKIKEILRNIEEALLPMCF
ncbi:cleavage and polyadenylation specificity factor subunit 3, putative [Plasmodium malariae]|uniref:Cleavage and polyadenylation specificity factor subunit 3, putative n=1 Tax=Plasmodium malariae TaxID=5858 RepID=A0A1D3SQK7_PLAMA|nr:cleavage and polyadenylation specificity factor subunit 3, putative [Plasmodium malariae]SCO94187.1 cleavage and polyadenylation specificity factor subunit 3, putative [Plasmodium malariae]